MTLDDLLRGVNDWCGSHKIVPANGQAADDIKERTVRYYRTLGLVDHPAADGALYGEKHHLQLVAIKLLQAQGVPLRRIRELLFGRNLAQLREIESRGLREAKAKLRAPMLSGLPDELWRMTTLDDEFLLVSRMGRVLDPAKREAILHILNT